jgi:outer membrane protein TolC
MNGTHCLRAAFAASMILALDALTGCAHYSPKPLAPAQSLQDLQARHLTDPQLLQQIAAKLGRTDSTIGAKHFDRAELLVAALELNPGLAEARAQLEQTAVAVKTARAIQNPTLSLASEFDLTRAAESPWLWGLGSSVLVDAFTGRRLRINLAETNVRGARADFADALWNVRRDVRAALLAVIVAERRIALLESDVRQRSDLAQLAHARIEAGESARSEGLQADLEFARSRAALEEARRALIDSRSKLAGGIGITEAALQEVAVTWDDLEQLPSLTDASLADRRAQALLSRADLERAIADYDAREFELQQQMGAQYLQTSLGPGYTYDHGIRKSTFSASIALPIFNRNEGPIGEALAAREVAGRHALTVQAKILNEIDAAADTYRTAVEALDRTQAQRVASESLAESARRAFDVEAIDRPTLLAAESALTTERLAELDALDRTQQALGALEDALRTPLTGSETLLK